MAQLLPPVELRPPLDRPPLLPVDYDGRTYLVEDLETFRAHVEQTRHRNLLNALNPLAMPPPSHFAGQQAAESLPPLPTAPALPAAPPSAYSLEQWQTPIRDQQDRDTCWAFAGLAALEAAYLRTYGLTLDLSEQYFFHICRATSLAGDYMTTNWLCESATSMWGAGGNSGSINSLARWWVPLENLAPYQTQAHLQALATSLGAGSLPWVPSTTQEQIDLFEWNDQLVPRAARWNCVYGVTSTAPLPDLSVNAIKAVLLTNHEVVVDIATMFAVDSTGRWIYQSNPNPGGHVFVIVGYDDNDVDGTFKVKNSWGGSAFTRVAYSFFTHSDAYFGGNYITGIVAPGGSPQRLAWWLGRWNQDHDGWRGTHVIRRFTDPSNPTKLGNYYRTDGTKLDVNGYMDPNGQHAAFWIASAPGKVQPGSEIGQPFNVYIFSWEPPSVAGTTVWSNIPFGAQLSLDSIESTPAQAFDPRVWLGTWAMDHDGWKGQLTVSAIGPPLPFARLIPVVASYAPIGGSPIPTQGVVWNGAEHHMSLAITFSTGNVQPFELFHHTWEADLFSGTTVWSGITFGAKGHRVNEAQYALAMQDGRLLHTVRYAAGNWLAAESMAQAAAITGAVAAVASTAAWVSEAQFAMAMQDGRLLHTIRHSDGSWSPAGDMAGAAGITGPVHALAAASASPNEAQFALAMQDGRLLHTIRHADGSWQPAGNMAAAAAVSGAIQAAAAAGDAAHQAQFALAMQDGRLLHTIRHPDGSWQPAGDMAKAAAIPGHPTTVAACVDGVQVQFAVATQEGRLLHTIRHADGSWQPAGDMGAAAGIAGAVEALTAASTGSGEVQFAVAMQDGRLLHTIRHADGTWQPSGDMASAAGLSGQVLAVGAVSA